MIKSDSYQTLEDGIIECPICQENTNKYFKAPCKHAWCNVCHPNILSRNCPLCKQEFCTRKEDLIEIDGKKVQRIKSERPLSPNTVRRLRREETRRVLLLAAANSSNSCVPF